MSKFTDEQIEFLETAIVLVDGALAIQGINTSIYGDVNGRVHGDVNGRVHGDVDFIDGNVRFDVGSSVGGSVGGRVYGSVGKRLVKPN